MTVQEAVKEIVARSGGVKNAAVWLGVSRHTIHAWIAGRRHPTGAPVIRMALELGVPVSLFLPELKDARGRFVEV